MNCPACKCDASEVTSTMAFASVNLRERKCKKCGFIWGTSEMPCDISVLLEHLYKLTKRDIDDGVLRASQLYRDRVYSECVQETNLGSEADTPYLAQNPLPESN